jgi:lysophospholipase L1-like esterase
MTSDRSPRRGARAAPWGRLVAALWVVLAASGLAGCSGEVEKPGPVLLVGDSIFFLASDDLTQALRSDGWKVVIDAYPGAGIQGGGYTSLDWPSRLADLVGSVHPRAVVVELGTNGCDGCPSLAQAIDADMASLRGVEPVLWLTVNTEGPRAELGQQVNAALAGATGRHESLELLRYDEWMKGRTDLVPADDVHPTAEGNKAVARHVADALDERSGGWHRLRNRAVGAVVVIAIIIVLLLRPRRSAVSTRR